MLNNKCEASPVTFEIVVSKPVSIALLVSNCQSYKVTLVYFPLIITCLGHLGNELLHPPQPTSWKIPEHARMK